MVILWLVHRKCEEVSGWLSGRKKIPVCHETVMKTKIFVESQCNSGEFSTDRGKTAGKLCSCVLSSLIWKNMRMTTGDAGLWWEGCDTRKVGRLQRARYGGMVFQHLSERIVSDWQDRKNVFVSTVWIPEKYGWWKGKESFSLYDFLWYFSGG